MSITWIALTHNTGYIESVLWIHHLLKLSFILDENTQVYPVWLLG